MIDAAAQSIALSLGVSALVTVACRRVRMPALLPLILAGLGLGTSGLGFVDASSLGGALKGFITVAIGLLIFEGALHLSKEELSRAPRAVWGLLTIGAIVTWIGAACGARFVLQMSWPVSILLGASLIVTGPTVVQPLLRLLHVPPRVHTALSAEAVLIDPIAVVATITTLEIVRLSAAAGPEFTLAEEGLWLFVKPLLGGAGVGVVMGFVGFGLLRLYGTAERLESSLLNLIAVGVCMTCVGIGEAITPEGGLAAVTICGVIMARARVLGATELRSFKELLAVMLVGTLFVLLASRFDVARLTDLGWREGAFVFLLIFLVRPIAVAISTVGSKLTVGERFFAGTFAPRGIVALSVAAVAAAELAALSPAAPPGDLAAPSLNFAADAERLESTTFVVIVGTVLLASVFSPLLAWALRLKAGEGSSLIIVGGHPLGLALGRLLRDCGVECRIIDSNTLRAFTAAQSGLDAIEGDATDSRWMDDIGAPHGAGWLLAWTGNHDVDQLAVRWAMERLGEKRAAMWSSRPARGSLDRCDVSQGQAVTEAIDQFGDGLLDIVRSEDPAACDRVLGWVRDGHFSLRTGVGSTPVAANGLVFIGTAPRRHTAAHDRVGAGRAIAAADPQEVAAASAAREES